MDQREITYTVLALTTGGSTSHEMHEKHLLVCMENAICPYSFAFVRDSFLQTLVWISGEHIGQQHYIVERSYIGQQASGWVMWSCLGVHIYTESYSRLSACSVFLPAYGGLLDRFSGPRTTSRGSIPKIAVLLIHLHTVFVVWNEQKERTGTIDYSWQRSRRNFY